VVIDDDKETIQLFSDLLSSNGIKVVGKGYNGQDAVFLFQKLKPDVLFLDILMPVYDERPTLL
jgi:chemotaxis response regulator CheB